MINFVVGTCKRRAALMVLALLVSLSSFAGQVTLAWNPSEGAEGYRIYWGTQSGVYTYSNDCGAATQTTVTGLVNTITYYFAVTAYNVAGESDFSSEVSTTIPPLSPAEYLQMSPGIFSWSIPEQSDTLRGFIVYRKEVGVIGVRSWKVKDPNARALAMADLVPGATYRFWVKCFTTYGSKQTHDYRVIFSEPSDVFTWVEPLEIYTGDFVLLPPFPLEAGGARIVFFDGAGDRRQVLGSFDLAAWTHLGEATEVIQGQYQFVDLLPAEARFYRVE
jgi:hypothetical protein